MATSVRQTVWNCLSGTQLELPDAAMAPYILLVEDSAAACELIEQAFGQQARAGALRAVPDVMSALAFLNHQADSREAGLPAAVLLDLKLGGEHGLQFLRRLREDSRLNRLPVIVLTTSDDPRDIDACYRCGANGYAVKPDRFDDLAVMVGDLCRYWLHWNRTVPLEGRPC
jgi:CheY-like chemotaxis protein